LFRLQNQNFNPGEYSLLVQGTDMSGNSSGKPFEITFRILEGYKKTQFWVSPNPSESITVAKIIVSDLENPIKSSLSVYNSIGKKLMDLPYEAFVGPNEVFLPLKQLFGSGIFIIRNSIEWSHDKKETSEFKVIIR
jgi:hypothetical protein